MNLSTATLATSLASALWAGLVVGISFVAQPAKFKTPQLTRNVALATGRRIFRSMHAAEAVLALACLLLANAAEGLLPAWPLLLATLILGLQAFALMPALSLRVDALLAGKPFPPSAHHMIFALLEIAKLLLLLAFSARLIFLFPSVTMAA
jgi:hypothetical protein